MHGAIASANAQAWELKDRSEGLVS